MRAPASAIGVSCGRSLWLVETVIWPDRVCGACADQQLAVVDGEPTGPTAVAGYELVVGGNAHGDGGKALGHRQFARYYKQKYKPGDHRSSSAVSSVLASCVSQTARTVQLPHS